MKKYVSVDIEKLIRIFMSVLIWFFLWIVLSLRNVKFVCIVSIMMVLINRNRVLMLDFRLFMLLFFCVKNG